MRNYMREVRKRKPLYATWIGIKQRCYNINNLAYLRYGGRGIVVCSEWLNNYEAFEKWALLSGWQHGLTIDRIDNNGNYCPENCQLLSKSQNTKKNCGNKISEDGVREIRRLLAGGVRLSMVCEKFGLSYRQIKRINERINWGSVN